MPAEQEVIAIHEDNAQLHNVAVPRAVINVPKVVGRAQQDHEPEVEDVIEAVEHQAVVDDK